MRVGWISRLRGFAARVLGLFASRKRDRDFDQEVQSHLELLAERFAAQGMSRETAAAAARRQFGNTTLLQEERRELRTLVSLEDLGRDLRYALRVLFRNPGFTAVAVITLALGIGANTAIFSLVYAVLLRPLPYHDASRLVVLNETTPKVGNVSVSYPNFLDWRAGSRTFKQMAAVHDISFNLSDVRQPESINGEAVSPNFLSMLGVHPILGRDFEPTEAAPGTAPVALISYSLWQSQFNGDRNAIGQAIRLDGRGFTVVGVLPANYRWIEQTDILEPIGVWATGNPKVTDRGERGDMIVVGRLAPDVSLTQARAEMQGIAERLAKEFPEANAQFGVRLRPMRDAFVSSLRPALLVLFAAVAFVLLIACANVANLFLVHGAVRTKEIALRVAFGASRARIIRQMLTESLILATLGAALGLGLGVGAIHGMARLIPAEILLGARVNLNSAVLLVTAGVVLLAATLFGLAPLVCWVSPDVHSELKAGTRTASAGAAQGRLRSALVVAEISLALVLLAGAGLMMKSLYLLFSVSPGFQPSRVVTMEIDLRAPQYSKDAAMLSFWRRLLGQVRALPGVRSAALGTGVPFTDDHSRADITIEGMLQPSLGAWPHPDIHVISPGYVRTLRVPVLRGRVFRRADREHSPAVALVNEMLARKFFPDGDAVGKRFMFGHPSPKQPPSWITVVGVVGDTKLYGLTHPARLEVYVPLPQLAMNDMQLLVKSDTEPGLLISEIRHAVASIDRSQPLDSISTMKHLVSGSTAPRRITLILLGAFSGLALVLAAIGIYGVISYSVARRTREFGIRVALGARKEDVLSLVLRQGTVLTLLGVGLGLAAAFALTRFLSSLLYGVKATDAVTFTVVSILLASVALLACYVPAHRATKVDPMVALRYE
jgi:putative ABC transport system permease protein